MAGPRVQVSMSVDMALAERLAELGRALSEAARALRPFAEEAAYREHWAREQVAAAGESWETHMAKFDGTVVSRAEPANAPCLTSGCPLSGGHWCPGGVCDLVRG